MEVVEQGCIAITNVGLRDSSIQQRHCDFVYETVQGVPSVEETVPSF
jgi:hypothetical protein